MKVLVVSDVHANIAALNTILEKEADYDILCCAGDYTDYGIYPAEVIERFRNLKNTHLVYGNHDLHVINTYESKEWKNVEDGKYKWVHYNCEQLNDQDIRWLKQLPETAYFEADGWKYGIASTWIGIGNALIGSLLAWVVLGRRTKVMTQHLGSRTMPDFFGERYKSKSLKITASVIVFVFLIPYTASVYNGLSRLFAMAFNIPYTWCVVTMAAFTALYVCLLYTSPSPRDRG